MQLIIYNLLHVVKIKIQIQRKEIMSEESVFTRRLFDLIKTSGKSVNRIERELNYPRNAINNYKSGGEPSGIRLMELAEYFNVSPAYLIGKSEIGPKISTNDIFATLDVKQKIEIGRLYQEWAASKINTQTSIN